MATRVLRFGMDTRSSPLAAGPYQVLRTLNADLPAPGILRRRRGITTDVDVDFDIGAVGPWRVFPWRVGANTYRVVCGSDAVAFINPINGYLYARDALTAAILSDPLTAVADEWGLGLPESEDPTTIVGDELSALGTGYFLYGVVAWDEDRRVRSPIVWLAATPRDGLLSHYHTDKLQQVNAFNEQIIVPSVDAPEGASHILYYRARMMSGSEVYESIPSPTGEARLARRIAKEPVSNDVAGSWDDAGGQVEGDLFDHATDVVPFCKATAHFDGCWFWTVADNAKDAYRVYYTVKGCPEIYGGTDLAILGSERGGTMQGIARFSVPSDCGPPTAIVANGPALLVLCEAGAWQVVRSHGGAGLYDVVYMPLWTGCVSRATVASSPVGIWWLSRQGVVLWPTGGMPQVVTEDVLDPDVAPTQFAADLSGASGAYDVKRHAYHVAVPTADGQVVLVVRGDRVPEYSVWTLDEPVVGMGYDYTLGEVLYAFAGEDEPVLKHATDGDHADGETPFAMTLEVVCGAAERGAQTKRSCGVQVSAHRGDVGGESVITCAVRGQRTTEGESGEERSVRLTWAKGEYGPRQMPAQVLPGRMYRVTLTHEADEPIDVRELIIGVADEMQTLAGIG